MSVAVGHPQPQPERARPWTDQISFRTGSQRGRTAAALLTMMILAISVLMGLSAIRQTAPAGELPQPSGHAQPAPMPSR
jgi:hypothetical protein